MRDGRGPGLPTVPVAVLEAVLDGSASAETIGRVLGAALVPALDAADSATSAEATLCASLEGFGFGPARLTTRGPVLLVHLAAPSFRLAPLAESFVASVLGSASGVPVGALAFAEGEGGWAVAVLHAGVARFLREKRAGALADALAFLEV